MMITIVLRIIVVNGSFIVIVTATVTVVTIYLRACLLGEKFSLNRLFI